MSGPASHRVSASPVVRHVLDRIHETLPPGTTREVRMFGAVAVMLDDAMSVAVHGDGDLLVRVDPARDADLLLRTGASRAHMGAHRSMGQGWIRVDGTTLTSDADLEAWMRESTSYLAHRAR